MSTKSNSIKPPRNFWPWGVSLTLLVFCAGTVALVVMACFQRTDLVSANYYEDEIRFQKQIERVERVRQLDSRAGVSYDVNSERITISLPPEHVGLAAHGKIQLYRPSEAGLDQQLNLQIDSQGRQIIDAAQLKSGLWKVKVMWTAGSEDYFLDQKVVIKSKNS